MDLTEIAGTEGLIARCEARTTALFGSARTLWTTEGSSHAVRAMVWLAAVRYRARRPGTPRIAAARNVHKSFLYACALAGADPVWIWPDAPGDRCACPVSPASLARTLDAMSDPPAAAYVTSPDYLGGTQDLAGLAEVCHARGVPLLVDGAHGAYLRFLDPSRHPLDLGADLVCDSAHKTLPVLTGGAYLHIGRGAPVSFLGWARGALDLTGSTSPSWLTLASLDLCDLYLSDGYRERLAGTVRELDALRERLRGQGWTIEESDPLRIVIRGDGTALADRLRQGGIEAEHADRDHLVLMPGPENSGEDRERLAAVLGRWDGPPPTPPVLPSARGEIVLSLRDALSAPRETVPVEEAVGRICAAPTVSCPPAVPVVMPGERIGPEAVELSRYYGVGTMDVVR